MKKIYLFIVLFFTTLAGHSQECYTPQPNITSDIRVNPVTYDHDIDSIYITHWASRQYINVLGYTDASREYRLDYDLDIQSTVVEGTTVYCGIFKNVAFSAVLAPVTYIAAEITDLKFKCTSDRILKQEATHLQIEIDAFEFLKKNAEAILLNNFKEPVFVVDKEAMKHTVNSRRERALEEVRALVEHNANKYHAEFDSPENNLADSQRCSQAENLQIYDKITSPVTYWFSTLFKK